jgi:hypothetical protein
MALSKITNASLSTGIDSAKIGAGDVSNSEHAFLNSVTSNVQTQIDGAGVTDVKFLAHSTGINNVTGAGTIYKILFHTEIYDTANAFTSQHTFTAPENGKYLLAGFTTVTGLTSNADTFQIQIVTSNRSYGIQPHNPNDLAGSSSAGQWGDGISIIADMEASDTAYMTVAVYGESSDVCDVAGVGSAGHFTSFSGALLA